MKNKYIKLLDIAYHAGQQISKLAAWCVINDINLYFLKDKSQTLKDLLVSEKEFMDITESEWMGYFFNVESTRNILATKIKAPMENIKLVCFSIPEILNLIDTHEKAVAEEARLKTKKNPTEQVIDGFRLAFFTGKDLKPKDDPIALKNWSGEDFKQDLTFRDFFGDEILEIGFVLENGRCRINLELDSNTTGNNQKVFKFFDFI